MRSLVIPLLLLIFSEQNVRSQISQNSGLENRKHTSAVRLTESITIDGALNETVWQSAPIATDFIQTELTPGKNSNYKTEVRVLYDDKFIYFGATMIDPNPDSIFRELIIRDQISNANTDWFAVLIDTYRDGNNGTAFIITPSSVQADARQYAGGNEMGFTEDYAWNAVWEAKSLITKNGWSTEMKIPYSALRFPKNDEQKWRINFARQVRRTREKSFWNYVNPLIIGIVPQCGEIDGLKNIVSPIRLQAFPFGAVYSENTRVKNSDGTISSAWQNTITGGLDIKYGINNAYTLDLTLIPDFGQVQSDPRIVNLTPFEVRFDENRQFFTEGVELFNRGTYFYSRRIGAVSDYFVNNLYNNLKSNETVTNLPSQAQLYNATKISGRDASGLGIGFLNAVAAPTYATITDEKGTSHKQQVTPLTNFNVISFDKNLPNNSYITLINTNVWRSGDAYDANLTAVYAELKNKKNTYSTVLSSSFSTQQFAVENKNGYAFDVQAGKISGNYQWWTFNSLRSNLYNPNDFGFENQLNSVQFGIWNAYFQNTPRGNFTRWNVTADIYVNRLYSPNVRVTEGFESNAFFLTKNIFAFGGNLKISPNGSHDYYEPRTSDYSRYLNVPGNTLLGGFISTDYIKPIALDVKASIRPYSENNRLASSLAIGPRFRFNDKVSLILSSEADKFDNFINYVGADVNSIGYSKLSSSDILMGKRQQLTVINAATLKWSFNYVMGISFKLRHYWTRINYDAYYLLGSEGNLLNTEYTGSDSKNESLHNTNFNIFNIDAAFTWRFAPGSDFIINWKNNIFNGDNNVALNYFDNVGNLFSNPQNNSFSFKLIYFLDYLQFKKKKL